MHKVQDCLLAYVVEKDIGNGRERGEKRVKPSWPTFGHKDARWSVSTVDNKHIPWMVDLADLGQTVEILGDCDGIMHMAAMANDAAAVYLSCAGFVAGSRFSIWEKIQLLIFIPLCFLRIVRWRVLRLFKIPQPIGASPN